MFLRLEEQRVDALGVVVGSLVLGASAGDVDPFSEAVGPLAPVGFAEQIEGHQVEQLGEPGAVGEGADPVADPAVDLSEELLDRTGRVQPVGLPGRDLRPGQLAIGVHPLDRQSERTVLAAGVLDADRGLEPVPGFEAVKGIQKRAADRVAAVCQDFVREMLAELAPEVPLALAVLDLVAEASAPARYRRR